MSAHPRELAVPFEELLQVDLCGETILRGKTDFRENVGIFIPMADALQILMAALIIEDEGCDAVPQAFFEHDHSAYTTVAVIKRPDALKADVEIKNVAEFDSLRRFICFDEAAQFFVDFLRRCGAGEGRGSGVLAICTGRSLSSLVTPSVGKRQCMQLPDRRLGKGSHSLYQNIVEAPELISDFDEVIDFQRLVEERDLVGLVERLHLLPRHAVACHPAVAVRHVDLNIIIKASVIR